MFNDNNRRPGPISHFLPSYSGYDGIGGNFAGGLSNLFEMIIRLINGLRR